MSFMKRTIFKDDADKDIYLYHLMLDLGERFSDVFYHEFNHTMKLSDGKIATFKTSTYSMCLEVDTGKYNEHGEREAFELCEIGTENSMYIMNFRTYRAWGRNFIENDSRGREYTFFDSDGLMDDDELDMKFYDGKIGMQEDEYFQISLIRPDVVLKYEDLERYMEALTCKSEKLKNLCFYYRHDAPISVQDYHYLYDEVLRYIEEFVPCQ
ncbi:hypothetical protein [Salmonella enterica]|uniref:hypothetical protein n=1 Tax=Salmonella enterica TaxID=28901 RepID=UPI003A81124A